MNSFAPLIIESELEGWFFVRRLAEEWSSGANRFQRPGERLYLAHSGNKVIGVCGLNIDPYATDPTIGRVRRLFVTSEHRGKRIGSRLIRSVVAAAHGKFRLLRVRTENPIAGALYERLGFQPVIGATDCTHMLALQFAGQTYRPEAPLPVPNGESLPPAQ
jgi:RimJ/RimL family protein N-acetyltransferase